MKVFVKKTMEKLQKKEFHSDDLYEFYNFENGSVGNTLISAGIVTRLYKKEIKSIDEAEIANQIVEFIRNYDIDERGTHNWNLYSLNGNIEIRTGHLLKEITMNENEYLEYLNEILKSGIASYIEFSF